jgi:hypothetical protein
MVHRPEVLGRLSRLLVVLFFYCDWPLWLQIVLAPLAVAFDFSWLALYWALERWFPRKPVSTDS